VSGPPLLTRRILILGLLVNIALVPRFAVAQDSETTGSINFAEEPFPVSSTDRRKLPRRFRLQEVSYRTEQPAGTVVVDTARRFLYLTLGRGRALRYGIGVGREGFAWAGMAEIGRNAPWPRWVPPKEMVARDPFAAEWADGMPGGPSNPLGARALYLYANGIDTLYRIHGTNQPASIGQAISSGCVRLLNADIIDLYSRVDVGTKVVVLGGSGETARVALTHQHASPPEPRRLRKRLVFSPQKSAPKPKLVRKNNFNLARKQTAQ
jgi:lipoprotein-anchoring transpeptidase ErfK/SrfK